MACYYPLEGYVGPGGALVFKREQSISGQRLDVPCRRCLGCRIQYRKEWGTRAVHEAQMHEHNSFITLTYDNEHLPRDLNLDHKHWQKFIKSLRKRTGKKIRYMMCGEYGPKTHRPHFHAIIFGHWPDDAKEWRTNPGGNKIYRSEQLEDTWQKGFVEFGAVTQQSAEYVAGYVHKKVMGSRAEAHYTVTDEDGVIIGMRKPEYAKMSLKPGLGQAWIEKYKDDVFPNDYITGKDGIKSPVPKYYRDWLKKHDPDLYEQLRRKRVHEAKHNPENDRERLPIREKVAIAKNKFKTLRSRHEA